MKPNYRAEIWFQHSEDGKEDLLEDQLKRFMNANGMCVRGVVVFRIYPNGDVAPWELPVDR